MTGPDHAQAWRSAVDAFNRGDATAAAGFAQQALAIAPEHADAWHLLGCARLNLGQNAAAVEALRKALSLRPGEARMNHALGTACLAQGDLPAACAALLAACAGADVALDSWFKLGLALGRARHWPIAAAALLRATRIDPNHAQAMMGFAECAQQQLREGQRAPAPARNDAVDGLVSFVVCSITPDKIVRLRARLAELFAGQPWELVVVTDARSLCEGYTRGIAQTRGEWLVLCHDDIQLVAEDFAARLRAGLARFELFGPAGGTRISGPSWGWSGPPHTHCWIAHPDANGRPLMLLLGNQGGTIAGAVLLDGVFLAGHRPVFERIGFDADTFDGFHFYDLDFSYRASLAGVRCGICLDLGVLHESSGNYNAAYWQYAQKFLAKFPEVPRVPHAPQVLGQLALADAAELVLVQDWLAQWTTQTDGELEQRVRDHVARVFPIGIPVAQEPLQ